MRTPLQRATEPRFGGTLATLSGGTMRRHSRAVMRRGLGAVTGILGVVIGWPDRTPTFPVWMSFCALASALSAKRGSR